ncbi:MAG: ABC transporter permease [Verrucomicrobia bacterium]|nr:ABC transporter permease [Verrucomicrobiota bacterium]
MTDLLFALRRLRKSPAFTLFAVLTLALGIGASTAMFSVVEGVLLRPLPVREPERLMRLYESYLDRPSWLGSVSVPNYRDWAEQTKSFEGLSAQRYASVALREGSTPPERLRAANVTANYFSVVGGTPLLGRTLREGEDAAGAEPVAVISEGLWRTRFKAASDIIGRRFVLDGLSTEVVGVMPDRFRLPYDRVQIWTPLVFPQSAVTQRGNHSYDVVGRLRAGVTLEAARQDLRAIAAEIARKYPEAQVNRTVVVTPVVESMTGTARRSLVLLSVAAACVLAIAGANVTGLLLARAAALRRELSVRMALGAGRWQIVRQLVAESALLALGGAALGALFAHWGVDAFVALAGNALPRAHEVQVNAGALTFAVGAALAVGIVCGLLPAWATLRRHDLAAGLQTRDGSGVGGRQRLRAFLVGAEIAATLVLLAGGGLLFRSLQHLLETPSGLRPEGVLTARVALPAERYPTPAALAEFYGRLDRQLAAAPGVEAAGGISILPIDDWGTNGDFLIEGRPPFPAGAEPNAEYRSVFGNYYRAVGMRLAAGRFLDARDDLNAPRAVMINETMARRFWPSVQEAVGARLGGFSAKDEWWTIVGVFADVRQSGLDRAVELEVHFSCAQSPHAGSAGESFAQNVTLAARAAGGQAATALATSLREAVRVVDGGLPLYRVMPMTEILDESTAARRLNLRLLGCFGGVALVLAAVGLYGVTSFLVAQREREFGVRLAIGAQAPDILRLVLRQGMLLTAAGGVVGLVAALGLGRLLGSLLYGVPFWDPLVLGASVIILGCVTLLACFLPAWRASRVDPLVVLRAE